jgi:ferric-dicitrate binding protein FerR (iron transport regulator)
MPRDFEPRARRGVRNITSLLTLRRGVALLAAAALLNVACVRAGATTPARTHAPLGQVTAAAGLTLDGSPAVAGQTLFPGSNIGAAERTRPALSLGNLARLELSGGTILRLDFSDSSLDGSLETGGARVYAPRGVAASLTTADASVVSDTTADPALFSVEVSEDGTTLSVQQGRVEMRAGGRVLTAAAGQMLRAAHGSAPEPPQGQNLSGKQKTGIFVGIAAALAAVILVVTNREKEEEIIFGSCPIILSPTDGTLPPCL